MKFIGVLLICGLIAFATYQTIQIIRVVKERKKAKSNIKGDESENGNS